MIMVVPMTTTMMMIMAYELTYIQASMVSLKTLTYFISGQCQFNFWNIKMKLTILFCCVIAPLATLALDNDRSIPVIKADWEGFKVSWALLQKAGKTFNLKLSSKLTP